MVKLLNQNCFLHLMIYPHANIHSCQLINSYALSIYIQGMILMRINIIVRTVKSENPLIYIGIYDYLRMQ